jgi:hypothetical protein
MPFVPNAGDLARWLGADAGKTISIERHLGNQMNEPSAYSMP